MKLKTVTALFMSLGLAASSGVAIADSGYVANTSQTVTPSISGQPVWTGEVPTSATTGLGDEFFYRDVDNTGEIQACGGPNIAFSFSLTKRWSGSGSAVSITVEGLSPEGQAIFSQSGAVSGVTTFQIKGTPYCRDPYPVSSLKITTTVTNISTSAKLTTVNTVPYSLNRFAERPTIVFRDTYKPTATLGDTTLTTDFFRDRSSYPAVTSYRLGIAQSDTSAGLENVNPTQVIDLGLFDSPKQELPIEKIAPLISNPAGFYTIHAKAINSVGESLLWSRASLPLKAQDLLDKFEALKAAVKAQADAALKKKQAAGLTKKYKTCSALNALYPGGLALSSKSKNAGKSVKQKPYVSSKGYKLNLSLDSDKDGIACER
jgi:hypothetical protein